jgi:hypothetical protein
MSDLEFWPYTDEEWERLQEEIGEEYLSLSADWEFHEERKYRESLAASYPQDAKAIEARQWLEKYAAV